MDITTRTLHYTSHIKTVDLFYSFRSPYSQIIVSRLRKWADKRGIKVRVRVLMPMVLRGLAVPFSKALFIIKDCAREARIWGIPFGYCCDPIRGGGEGVRRAMDAYIIAERHNKALEYISAFGTLVWGYGVNAASDSGLKRICENCGIPWNEVSAALGREDVKEEWTAITDANKEYLYDKGLWGVPCVEWDGRMVWGQDKLYQIFEAAS